MEKTKEKKQDVRNNGEKKKLTKDEMIEQLENEIKQIIKIYHEKTGALVHIREID